MTTCPRCGQPVSAWTRDLSSGLCAACVQAKAKEEAEERAGAEARTEAQRQEVAKSIERLQKLHAEGALTEEEFQQLEAVRKSTAAPGPPARHTVKKVVVGILAAVAATLGLIKGCLELRKNDEIWAEKRQKAEREKQAADHKEASLTALRQLYGPWLLVSEETSGKKAKEDVERQPVFQAQDERTVEGRWILKKNNKVYQSGWIRFPLDQGTSKSVDLVRWGFRYLGIFSIEGETLYLCHNDGKGKERPREFATKPGDGFTYSVWKRSKKQ